MPICPYCEGEVNKRNIGLEFIDKEYYGTHTEAYIFYCPHCKKIIDIEMMR